MVAPILILIFFFAMLFFTFWNLQALTHVNKLSIVALNLVFIYVFIFILMVIILLFLLIVILSRRIEN